MTVTSGQANTDPVVETPSVPPATVDQDYVLQINASDPDDDRLAYFLTEAPDNLSIDQGSGQISFVAQNNQVGQQQVTVQVRDGRGGSPGRVSILPCSVHPSITRHASSPIRP